MNLTVGYLTGAPFEAGEHVHIIGDADKVANLMKAVWDANDLAVELC